MRDALRGPFNDNHQGAFLAGLPGGEESIKFGIVGAIRHPQVNNDSVNYSKDPWAEQPTQMISYVSCHDDMCWWIAESKYPGYYSRRIGKA